MRVELTVRAYWRMSASVMVAWRLVLTGAERVEEASSVRAAQISVSFIIAA